MIPKRKPLPPRAAERALEFTRFVLAGLANTAIGYAAYYLLLGALGHTAAFAAGYVIGIVAAYLLNTVFVFRAGLRVRSAVRYPLVYVVQYAAGALLLELLIRTLRLDARWAALIALALTTPLSYLLNRFALRGR